MKFCEVVPNGNANQQNGEVVFPIKMRHREKQLPVLEYLGILERLFNVCCKAGKADRNVWSICYKGWTRVDKSCDLITKLSLDASRGVPRPLEL